MGSTGGWRGHSRHGRHSGPWGSVLSTQSGGEEEEEEEGIFGVVLFVLPSHHSTARALLSGDPEHLPSHGKQGMLSLFCSACVHAWHSLLNCLYLNPRDFLLLPFPFYSRSRCWGCVAGVKHGPRVIAAIQRRFLVSFGGRGGFYLRFLFLFAPGWQSVPRAVSSRGSSGRAHPANPAQQLLYKR